MTKLTAETITDDDIEDVYRVASGTGMSDIDPDTLQLCSAARAEHHADCGAVLCAFECTADFSAEQTWSARAQLAEMINSKRGVE